jgi:TatD DNase family protein
MLGLHPEEVRADWRDQLSEIRKCLNTSLTSHLAPLTSPVIAIGEVGLDFYWSREFEQEQLLAFEEQVRWSIELRLPLMIHCRKAQNEMVSILKRYKDQLPGGVFHCFTGNAQEARQLLEFDRFVLGIGGVLTFKKSNLPATLAPTVASGSAADGDISAPTVVSGSAADGVPLERLVLETDAPYMAPVPMRGQRNESAYIRHVITRLAEAYHVTEDDICRQTTANVRRVFGL